jgi:hypothetical protein
MYKNVVFPEPVGADVIGKHLLSLSRLKIASTEQLFNHAPSTLLMVSRCNKGGKD